MAGTSPAITSSLSLRPLPFTLPLHARSGGCHRGLSVLGTASGFRHRARRRLRKLLRRVLDLLSEHLGLVGDRLRLPGHELALALRHLLRFLRAGELLPEIHGIREQLFRQRGVVRAEGAQLLLKILRQLPAYTHETVERLFSLGEIFLGELTSPCEAECGRLHRAFPALLSKFCRISCH